ncbi:MAG TPA: alpha/beta fold hydrolase [Blastocatellia bacterium]|nr:alpha/beta fold hydrolase [Blastocatellia bacterium]HMY74854.1 alpha/beta fold hydrolase [Blastocatellia bacterium]HMZ19590.1 alpha/beta fold hydrolase [Blastocatellia bacterium]
MLFLHGLGDSAHIFNDLAPQFAHRYRVLGLTRRGHGQSEVTASGYDTGTLVEDIRAFLDHEKIRQVTLVGHSLAGNEKNCWNKLSFLISRKTSLASGAK